MLRLLLSLPKPYFLIYKMGTIYLTRRTIGMIIKEPVQHLSQFLTLRRYTVVSGGYYQYFRPSLKEHGVPCNPCSRWTSENWPLGILQTFGQGKGHSVLPLPLVLAESPSSDKSSGWHVFYRNCVLSLVIQESRCPFFTKWLGWTSISAPQQRNNTWQIHPDSTPGSSHAKLCPPKAGPRYLCPGKSGKQYHSSLYH